MRAFTHVCSFQLSSLFVFMANVAWQLTFGDFFRAGLRGKERILLFNSVKSTPRPQYEKKVVASPNMHSYSPVLPFGLLIADNPP